LDNTGNTSELKEVLENLREKLNKEVTKNVMHTSKEYKNLLIISRRLDDVIVNYIKSSNK